MTGGSPRPRLSRPERSRPTRTPRTEPAGRQRRRQRAGVGPAHGGLVVHAPEMVPLTAERRAQARGALRVLYGDFLAGGGLDIVRASRCPEAPPTEGADA